MSNERTTDGEWTTFADARRRKFTMALALTPSERLAWLERAIEFARQTGALPRTRPPAESEG
jgi:hypothetical protein